MHTYYVLADVEHKSAAHTGWEPYITVDVVPDVNLDASSLEHPVQDLDTR